ncbi:MAG: hypothetical protein ACFFD2_09475 [Promethearchaeota archaeon]
MSNFVVTVDVVRKFSSSFQEIQERDAVESNVSKINAFRMKCYWTCLFLGV